MNEFKGLLARLVRYFSSNRKMIGLSILLLSGGVAGLDAFTPPEVPTDALYALPIWLGLEGFGVWGGLSVATSSIGLFYISNYLIGHDRANNLWPALLLTYGLFVLFTFGAYHFLLNQRQLAATRADLQTRLQELDGLYQQSQKLHHENLKLAVIEERNRLAREIHDVLAQGLAAIIFQVEAAYLNRTKPVVLEERLAQISELAHNNLHEARRSVANLRPLPLEGNSLGEALESKVHSFSKEQQLHSQFTLSGNERPLVSEVERSLYRITQEALTNVARHAQATDLRVTLDYDEEEVCLTVHDNGRGFEMEHFYTQGSRAWLSDESYLSEEKTGTETAKEKPDHKEKVHATKTFGLSTMQERATLIGGWASIQSHPGEGCRVRVIVPYTKASPLPHLETPSIATMSE